MTNILTKEITLQRIFEVRLLIISKIKKMVLIIYNTQTDDLQIHTDLPDLPDSPKKYNKLNKK